MVLSLKTFDWILIRSDYLVHVHIWRVLIYLSISDKICNYNKLPSLQNINLSRHDTLTGIPL